MSGTIDRVYEKMLSNFSMNSGGDLHLLYSEGRWDFSPLLSSPLLSVYPFNHPFPFGLSLPPVTNMSC